MYLYNNIYNITDSKKKTKNIYIYQLDSIIRTRANIKLYRYIHIISNNTYNNRTFFFFFHHYYYYYLSSSGF